MVRCFASLSMTKAHGSATKGSRTPLVAGVAAMLKQLNPDLPPHEIKRILKESYTVIDGEYRLLDALQAVTRAQSEARQKDSG